MGKSDTAFIQNHLLTQLLVFHFIKMLHLIFFQIMDYSLQKSQFHCDNMI